MFVEQSDKELKSIVKSALQSSGCSCFI